MTKFYSTGISSSGSQLAVNTTYTTTGQLTGRPPDGPYSGLYLRVYTHGTSVLAPVYDANGRPETQPLPINSDGSWAFYGSDASYDVIYSTDGAAVDVPAMVQVPSFTSASLPSADLQLAGRLAKLSDGSRGLEMSTGTNWFSVTDDLYNVRAFGAVGDGITNDSAAFAAAIAAVPATGGSVFVPPGTYAVNITIDRPKIRLLGGASMGRPTSTLNPAGLFPYDTTQPVITLSSDTQLNEGIQLVNLEINGKGTGSYGIKMLGGTYQSFFSQISIQNFTKKCLWIQSGVNQPCAFLYFNQFAIQPSNSANEHVVYIQQSNAAQYVEAIFFSNGAIHGGNQGLLAEIAGSQETIWTSVYMEANGSGLGVTLSTPFSTQARLNGNGLFLDSPTSTDTLLTVTFGSGATDVIANHVFGHVGIDGKVNLNGTARVNDSELHIPFQTQIVDPVMVGQTSQLSPADFATILQIANYNSSNNLFLGQTSTGTFTSVIGPTVVYQAVNGATVTQCQIGFFAANSDAGANLGTSGTRWNTVYATTGAINTSDEREKQDIAPIDDRVLDAWKDVEFVQYRWKASVAEKGAAARVHHGVIAQRIIDAFRRHGLDPYRYGLVGHDAWDAHEALDRVEGHVEHHRQIPAGDRYSIRADQCLFLEAALMRRTLRRLGAGI